MGRYDLMACVLWRIYLEFVFEFCDLLKLDLKLKDSLENINGF
jgi:hypothetical protein